VKLQRIEPLQRGVGRSAAVIGNALVNGFHYLALFAIGATIVWSAFVAYLDMAERGHASVDDILLLFIYLELGAMVGIYFRTNHMPVRFLMYVAMTTLTRLLMVDSHAPQRSEFALLLVTGAILLLALAVLVVRFASSRFPSMPQAASRIDQDR
jgi:phosphate starvation-inducible membrane PsiE